MTLLYFYYLDKLYLPVRTSDSKKKLELFDKRITYKKSNFSYNFISLDNGYYYINFIVKF
jgi:hypothetical protein